MVWMSRCHDFTSRVIDFAPLVTIDAARVAGCSATQEQRYTNMSTINETIANYVAAWNETDADRRRAVIARTWTEDGTYLDSHRDSEGHAAIDAMIVAVQQRFPGYRFRLSSGIETHHNRVRFSWSAGGTDNAPLFFAGTDFAILAGDGRFQAVTGFTDALPSTT
jgi:hypothetical protein